MKRLKRIFSAIIVLAIAATMSLTCLADTKDGILEPTFPADNNSVTLTWWCWAPNNAQQIAQFTAAYPNIKVNDPLIGAQDTEYDKLTTAIAAGTGAPDNVTIEYADINQFVNMGALINLTPYNAQYEQYYQTAALKLCTVNGKLYGMPSDYEPLAFFYNQDLYSQAGISSPPTTYAELATDAAKFHAALPNKYFTYFDLSSGMIESLFMQAGLAPYQKINGKWNLDINGSGEKKIVDFWGNLINTGAVQAETVWTASWLSNFTNNVYGCMVNASWCRGTVIAPDVTLSTNPWRAANVPQWSASGPFINGTNGGGSQAVTVQSKNPKEAALFAAYLTCSSANVNLTNAAYPAGVGVLSADKYFVNSSFYMGPDSMLGNQVDYPVWNKALTTVSTSWEWTPWTEYIQDQYAAELTKASQGQETWDQALDNVQSNVVQYATTQGYQVTQGTPGTTSPSSSSSGGMSTGVIVLIVVVVILALIIVLLLTRRKKKTA